MQTALLRYGCHIITQTNTLVCFSIYIIVLLYLTNTCLLRISLSVKTEIQETLCADNVSFES